MVDGQMNKNLSCNGSTQWGNNNRSF